MNYPFDIPPIEEQRRIAEVLRTQGRELELLNKKLELFKNQKRGLMEQLLTGKTWISEGVCL